MKNQISDRAPREDSIGSSVLKSVTKPGRYAGGEYGQIIKDKNAVKARFAFCFPDSYEIGMSNLGVRILYGVLNEQPDIWCERVYTPWVDMEDAMRKSGAPLCAAESGDPVKNFDILGVSMAYEMCYTNVLNMLDLAEIPLLASERGEDMPIVVGGGHCTYNPEPIADFFDAFLIGEGEEVIVEFTRLYIEMKENGSYTRKAFLHAAASRIEGVYVPSLYDVTYNPDGTVKAYTPLYEDVPKQVKKRIVKDMDSAYFPSYTIMPYMETVHDRIMLEVFRGCIRGCRFCQAGMICRPVREKSPETLNAQAKCLYASSGYEEISLTSLSISDYTGIAPLTEQLLSWTTKNMVNLSLPSLRVDNFPKELMERITSVRSSSLTFAPEAGTQRLRDVINKNVTRDDLMKAVNVAFDGGKTSVKLYFMEGLPTETLEDLDGIAEMAQSVVHEYYQNPNRQKGRSPSVTISVACFVPKPFTPFQWEAQDSLETLQEKQDYLFHKITDRKVRYDHHDAHTSVIEGVLARGDRKLGKALLLAHERGFRYDAWTEYFDYDKWLTIFRDTGIDPAFYANRRRAPDEVLPWDIIDIGVTKAFLNRERENAYAAATTPNCAEKCSGCGANRLGGKSPYCPGCQNAVESAKNAVEPTGDTAKFDELVKKFDFLPLETPKTMRVKFRKVGSLQYISHLDLHRTFNRVLVRAGIPLWYTQGFNPHAKMVFALQLSVGTESECEYLDVRVDRDISPEEMKHRMNEQLTDELRVLDVYEAKTKPTAVAWASYRYEIRPGENGEALFEQIRDLFRAPVIVKKKSKSGEKEIDILPLVRSLTVSYDPHTQHITMEAVLSAAGESYLNPEYLMTAIRERTGFLSGDLSKESYRILRTGMFLEDGKTAFR